MFACRKAVQEQQQQQQQSRQEDAKVSPPPENINLNQQVPDKSAAERERQRLREQERRRREAVSEYALLCVRVELDAYYPLIEGYSVRRKPLLTLSTWTSGGLTFQIW